MLFGFNSNMPELTKVKCKATKEGRKEGRKEVLGTTILICYLGLIAPSHRAVTFFRFFSQILSVL